VRDAALLALVAVVGLTHPATGAAPQTQAPPAKAASARTPVAIGAVTGEVRGRLSNAGQPVSGAALALLPFESAFDQALREARQQPAPPALAQARSDNQGAFTFATRALQAPNGARLRITAPGSVPLLLPVWIDVQAGEDVGSVELSRARSLAGKVVDPRGGPVLGAQVTLEVEAGNEPRQRLDSTTTGAGGTFRFESARARGGRLRVEAPGFAVLEVEVTQAGALSRPIALQPERLLEGRVLKADGRTPAAGALVRVETPHGTTRWVETGRDGTFHLEGVPPGRGTIKAWAADGAHASTPSPTQTTERVSLTLVPAASLRGRVVDGANGTPLAGRRVWLRGPSGMLGARSARDGRYELVGLPPQRYTVIVDDPDHVRFERGDVHLMSGVATSLDIALVRAATLDGRVLDEQGVPVAGASTRLSAAGQRPEPWAGLESPGVASRSGPDGRFRLARVRPGPRQILQVSHPEFAGSTISGLTLSAGLRGPEVVVVLRRGLSLRGVVKNESGHPVAGAQVSAASEQGPMSFGRGGAMVRVNRAGGDEGARQRRAETGADGRFELRGLTAGAMTVRVTAPGLASVEREGIKPEDQPEPLEITLGPGATLSGFVRDKRGRGQAGLMIVAQPSGAASASPFGGSGRFVATEASADDGAFLIEGLAAGASYDVQPLGARAGARRTGVVAPADGVELIVEGPGRISGRVLDADGGRPVTDFEVSYRASEGAGGGGRMVLRLGAGAGGGLRPLRVQADDGAFSLEGVPPGKWRVQAVAQGYPATSADVTLEEGSDVEGLELRLTRGLSLRGRVLDALTGRPILDASVQASAESGDTRAALLARLTGAANGTQTRSDADGRFVLQGLTAETYLVTARHEDWTEATQTVKLTAEAEATLELRLGKGGSVAGQVLAAGQPVAGAEVTLSAEGGDPLRLPGPLSNDNNDVSDAAGRFRFERLAPGRYKVQAAARGISSAEVEVALLQGQTREDVQLNLAGGALVRGRVTGLPPTQLGGVRITVDGRDGFFANTRTDAAGLFEVPGAPSGALDLHASAGDFASGMRSAHAQAVLAPDQTELEVELAFPQGFTLEGYVRRAGAPVADALVLAFPSAGSGRDASGPTDDQGAYRLQGLAAGSYTVRVAGLGGGGVNSVRSVTISGDTTLDFDLPTARLTGVVVDAEGGQPLADARLSVQALENPRGNNGATTDGNGRFELEGLEDGPQRLTVVRRSYETDTRQVTPSEGELRIELRRGEGVALLGRDATFGTPLRGLMVRVQDAAGATAFSGPVTLDSEGRGEIAALRPGRYSLRANSSGYALAVLPAFTVPGPAVLLALTPGGRLELRCGPETLARPGASARLLGADGQPYPLSIFAGESAWPLTRPLSQVDNLAPGRYTLVLDGGATKPVVVTEGQTTVVELP
jgi:protocatechuate 3,4-dioxygenase beta subunit